MRYSIGGISIEVISEDIGLLSFFSGFEAPSIECIDLLVSTERVDQITLPCGSIIIDDMFQWIESDDSEYANNLNLSIQGQTIVSMDVNRQWNNARIFYLKTDNEWEWKRTNPLFEILFRNCLAFHHGIVLHSSAIIWGNMSIVFTAPAGTGKTTQSNLWIQYMSARILNGDRPLIRAIDQKVIIYGTPWSGSSQQYSNEQLDLSALVLLEQAPVNSIKRLSPSTALNRILPRFFLPYNNANMMRLAMDTIDKVLISIPIYLLKCRPDKEAVDILYNIIHS